MFCRRARARFTTGGFSLSPFRPRWVATVVTALAAGLAAHAAADPPPRFVPFSQLVNGSADWVSVDGDRVAFGSGSSLFLARRDRGLVIESRLTLDAKIRNAVLAGDHVYLNERPGRLSVLDWTKSSARPLALNLNLRARAPLHLALMDDFLLVLEEGEGLHILALPSRPGACHGSHHQVFPDLRPVGFLAMQGRFSGIAASMRSVFIAVEGEGLAIVDARQPEQPVLAHRLGLRLDGDALAANGRTLYALGPSGLRMAELSDPEHPRVSSLHAEISGSALELGGRSLYVARRELGLVSFQDTEPQGTVHNVTVSSAKFTPASLTIAVGDTVRWQNAGGLHNVRSCMAGSGCSQAANESFTSGFPNGAGWTYSYTFTSAGLNPYFCENHGSDDMAGSVRVNPPAPPGVPDGTSGTPLRVGKLDPAGSSLSLQWDTTTCTGEMDHRIIHGGGSQLPTMLTGIYGLSGSRCNVGTTSPFTWTSVPDPMTDPDRFIWFLMLATDGASREGSWGQNSGAVERTGPGPGGSSAECGGTAKDLSNACGQ